MLEFQPVTLASITEIKPYFVCQDYRTCDFTEGGLFMWASYFNYEYAIFEDTLFIKGSAEDNLEELSFAVPIGKLSLKRSLPLLATYCIRQNIPFVLSAVPEKVAFELQGNFAGRIEELRDWADYLYEAGSLATLTGHKYNKKRNRVNKFRNTYPDFEYQRMDEHNREEVKNFFRDFRQAFEKDNMLFDYEESMVQVVLDHYKKFNFEGGIIKVAGKTVAFTVGEIVGDTLFVHIEKALREYDGVYEMINQQFARDIVQHYEKVRYINREEDVGDEGLRQAKLSYNPVAVLNKYNVIINQENFSD